MKKSRLKFFISLAMLVAASIPTLAEAVNTCSTLGVQKTLGIIVNYPRAKAGMSNNTLNNILFTGTPRNLNTYIQENSGGRASVEGTVVGPFTLSRNYLCTEVGQIWKEAITLARTQVDISSYTRIVVIAPKEANGEVGCKDGGLLGCADFTDLNGLPTGSKSYILVKTPQSNQDYYVALVIHEFGHNLGLMHANSEQFVGNDRGLSIGSVGTNDVEYREYDDPFSSMGSSASHPVSNQSTASPVIFGHFNGKHKAFLGWTTAEEITPVTTSGIYLLSPISRSTGRRILKIPRGNNGEYFWVNFHQPEGVYEFTLGPEAFKGVTIHHELPTHSPLATYLLDMKRGSVGSEMEDAELQFGNSWADPYSDVSISLGELNSDGTVPVTINFDSTICAYKRPTASVSSPLNALAGQSTNIGNISITNNDRASCPPRSFNFTQVLNQGFDYTLFPVAGLNFNVPTQISGESTMNIPFSLSIPRLIDDGPQHMPILITSSSFSNYSMSGGAQINVTKGYTLSLDITPAPVEGLLVPVKSSVVFTTKLFYAGVAGAPETAGKSVLIRLTNLTTGSSSTFKGVTNSSGSVSWNTKIPTADRWNVTTYISDKTVVPSSNFAEKVFISR